MTGIVTAAKFGFSELDLLDATTLGLVERDIKIFRVGTFTDSMGRTKSYTADDLDRAVENFYLLRDGNIVPNVPVREDHTISVKDIVGYFLSVRREGDFLLGDWEWSSAEFKARWDQKKYRNRSLEIGAYVSNDGTKYDPVVLGLAFVDFPAVEGLYRIADHGDDSMTKPTDQADDQADEQPDAPTDVAPEPAPDAAPDTPDAAAAGDADGGDADADADVADEALEPVGAHRANMQTTQTFRLYGAEVNDFARVQAHIVELETFRTETIESGRTAFVDGLATQNVITGPQAVTFRKLAVGMSAEQFEDFKAGFEGMAPANLFARHDLGGGGTPPDENDARVDRISVLEGIVANHRARGASAEDIQKMSSYKELQTLTQSATA